MQLEYEIIPGILGAMYAYQSVVLMVLLIARKLALRKGPISYHAYLFGTVK
jgi:hypothetical protein